MWIRPFYRLVGASPVPLDVGYLFTAAPAKCRHHSWPWTWGVSSQKFAAPASHNCRKTRCREDSMHGSADGQHCNQIDYILCRQRWRTSIQSVKKKKKRPWDDCGSDHELLIANFRLKLKKVGKTTRLFRYDLNQIPNDYTVEVINRFKGLDLIDRVPDELRTDVHDIVQETGCKTIHKKKKCKKANCGKCWKKW